MEMEIEIEEPSKSVLEYVQEWIDYYAGKRSSPLLPMIIEEVEKTKKRPSEDDVYIFRIPEESLQHQEKRRRFAPILYPIITSGVLDYLGNDTKLERQFRFKGIILEPDERTVRGRLIKEKDKNVEDPYDDEYRTWRPLELLARLNVPRLWYPPSEQHNVIGAGFDELYNRVNYSLMQVDSYSRPQLYILNVLPENAEKFKEILYGDTQLLMKITPFIEPDGQSINHLSLEQIYNEIKIAYFLNELLYGYTNVLSVHFIVMVDWFQTTRMKLGLFADPLKPTALDHFYNQLTIAEYAHTNITDYMTQNPSFGKLKAVMFQVLHTLEIAWHTNEFIHYDLHTGNILFKNTKYDDSPFKDRNLLYKRRDHDEWFVLRREDLDGHIVKIIDFGFSRIYAPSQPLHELYSLSLSHPPHLHDRLIGLEWPQNAMDLLRPNRYTDVRLFFLSLLALPTTFWDSITPEDKESFYQLSRFVLNFNEMNRIIDELSPNDDAFKQRQRYAGGRLTPANIASCPVCIGYLNRLGGYIRGDRTPGMTATDVLNHSFFDSLKRAPMTRPSHNFKATLASEDIVVSFLDEATYAETQMLKKKPANLFNLKSAIGTNELKCAICHGVAKTVNIEAKQIIPICSNLCAEFKYLYNGRTVFR